ncbi:hypothetical protein [Nonomuraea soli]|uniref:WD40 repeat domain-containing protein n=1 Tax=Nonomuraea soli TaxID=1032476 RepID=A0A7W0CV92_9ACTN|nr:hypothetical protein [Nonomuraea soli]MBA2897981.1 hypothetical protein [Nonomuraea soli]
MKMRLIRFGVLGLALLPAAPAVADVGAESLFTVKDQRIAQSSGLAVSEDGARFYTSGDAGSGLDEVWGLDRDGRTALTVTLPAGSNEDWEDIAVTRGADGRSKIFLADTGDAYTVRKKAGQAPRTEFGLTVFDEPAAGAAGTVAATGVADYRLAYQDNASRNSEALLVQPGTSRVFLLTKTERPGEKPDLWAAPALVAGKVNTLTRLVPGVPVPHATGAAFSPSGDRLVIRDDTTAYLWKVSGGDVAGALRAAPIRVSLPDQRQGEAVTFTPDGRSLLVSSEGPAQPVWQVPLPIEAGGVPPATALAPASAAVLDRDRAGDLRILLIACAAAAAAATVAFIRRRRRA